MNPSLCFRKVLIYIGVPSFIFVASTHSSFASNSPKIEQGHKAFQEENYSQSLDIYRAYLRKNPQAYDIWNLLGASYYHTGQAKLALIALKRALTGTEQKTQNYYFQGLCYQALGQNKEAEIFFEKAAQGGDKYGALALFSAITMAVQNHHDESVRELTKRFSEEHPNHPLHKEVKALRESLADGSQQDLQNQQSENNNKNLFQHHQLSFSDIPHFWYFQTGFDYSWGTRSQPAFYLGQSIVETGTPYEENIFNLSAGLGLGPFRWQGVELKAGYYYNQDWHSNSERIETYTNDFSDLEYFPYRQDLQLREHRLFFETKTALTSHISLAVYGDYFFIRSGSESTLAPERPEIRQTVDIAQGHSFVPWVSYAFNGQHQLYLQLYFNKYIDLEQSSRSQQSYSLSSPSFISFATGYEGLYWDDRLSLGLELLQNQYLANNYWDEYQRTGLAFSSAFKLSPNWKIMGKYLIYEDDYTYDQIKTGSCDFVVTFQQDGVNCPRLDEGTQMRIGASYELSRHQLLSFYFGAKNHTNPSLKVYDDDRLEFYFHYTLAFPTVKEAMRYRGGFHSVFTEKEVY